MLFFTFNVQLQFIKYAEIKIIQKTVYFYYIYFFNFIVKKEVSNYN